MKKILFLSLFVGFFTLSFKAIAFTPFVEITSPNNSNIALDSGQKIEIRWDSNVAINTMVDVYISNGTNKGPVLRGTNSGNLIYNPGVLPAGSNYKAYVSIVSESPIADSSDVPFTIRPKEVAPVITPVFTPFIKITSPNNSNIALDSGQKIEIRWDSNVAINTMVDVYISNGTNKGPVLRGTNSGNLIYNPGVLPAGSNYKAYVSIVSESPIADSSDVPFTIRGIIQNETENLNKNNYGEDNQNNNIVEDGNNNEGITNSHRNNIENVLKVLEKVAKTDKGASEKAREITQEENYSKDIMVEAIKKEENRSNLKTFFLGSDYKNLGVIRNQIVRYNTSLDKLIKVSEEVQDLDLKNELNTQSEIIKLEITQLENFVNENESKFSLLGWFVKMFR